MSYLKQINDYLQHTREFTVKELNAALKGLDPTSKHTTPANVAHTILGYMYSAKLKGRVPNYQECFDQATALKTAHKWLFSDSGKVDEQVDEAAKKEAKLKQPKKEKKKSTGLTRRELAQEIYGALSDKSRENVMKVFIQEFQVTEINAKAMYYTCKNFKPLLTN